MVNVAALLEEVTKLETFGEDEKYIKFRTDEMSIVMNNSDVTLNVDGTKKKIKMFDLVKAFADAVNCGEFWLDQIDDIVSSIEFDRANLREALEARRNPEVYSGL